MPQITEAYVGWLLDDLREAIEGNCFTAVESITSSLATELISRGWSQRALYEMRNLLVAALASENGWFDLENTLTRSRRRHECVFPVDSELIEEENRVFEKLELSIQERSQLLASPLYRDTARVLPTAPWYLLIQVDAFDPFSALEYAEGKLSSVLDILELFNFGGLKIHDLRIVACRDDGRLKRVSADHKWMQLPPAFQSATFDAIAEYMIDSTLNRVDRSRYATALSYYRMGMESMEPTARFVNLWVSLESFCRTPAFDSIIECVTSRIPELLSTAYIYSLVRNYCEDCRRTGVDLPGNIIAVDSYASRRLTITEIIVATQSGWTRGVKGGDSLSFTSFTTDQRNDIPPIESKPSWETLLSHRQRLYWHIQRLYRVRTL